MKFEIKLKGGSIGSINDAVYEVVDTVEEAKASVKRRNKQLTPGEKSYYKMKYYYCKVK